MGMNLMGFTNSKKENMGRAQCRSGRMVKIKSEARACRALQADFLLSTTGSHLRILGKEVKEIDPYSKKIVGSRKDKSGNHKTCWVQKSRTDGVQRGQSEESVCFQLLFLHLGRTVYVNQGHCGPRPPCKCLNKHFHFQAIEKVKAVSLFNFCVIFHSIQLKRTVRQTSLLSSSAL